MTYIYPSPQCRSVAEARAERNKLFELARSMRAAGNSFAVISKALGMTYNQVYWYVNK